MPVPVIKIAAPRIPAVLDPCVPAEPARAVETEGRYRNAHLVGVALGAIEAEHVDASGIRLETVNLAHAKLDRATAIDCVVDRGDLANLAARGAALTRTEFRGARMTGVQLVDCVLTDVAFHEVKLDLATMRFSKFRRVLFQDCKLAGADFTGADIRGVRFVDCDLSGAQFSQVQATGAVLHNCWLDGLGGVASLRGASARGDDLVSLSRVLAKALGIEIIEP